MKRVLIFLLLIMLVPQVALANPCQKGDQADLGRCVSQIYTWSIGIAGLLGVLMMVLGGYLVMTAGGNAEQSASGKGYVLSAIVGICLLLGAYIILSTINPDLTKFDVNLSGLKNNPQQPQQNATQIRGGAGQ